MFSATNPQAFLLMVSACSLVAVFTDLMWGRIFNWFTLPMLLIGIAVAFVTGGWTGALGALAGIATGLIAYGWMLFIGVMGGGDVKFLMALGAWGGLHYAAEVAVLGVLVGGAMAVILLLLKGRLPDFARRMYRFLLSLFIRELELDFPRIDKDLTMPFGIPIAVAAVWVALGHPLDTFGDGLWN